MTDRRANRSFLPNPGGGAFVETGNQGKVVCDSEGIFGAGLTEAKGVGSPDETTNLTAYIKQLVQAVSDLGTNDTLKAVLESTIGRAVGTPVRCAALVPVAGAAIPWNSQLYCIAEADGAVEIVDVIVQVGVTGWTGPVNIEFTTDNEHGLTGVSAPSILGDIAYFGSNKTFVASVNGTVGMKQLPFVLEDGKRLFIHGDTAGGSGGGMGMIYVLGRRFAGGAGLTFVGAVTPP